MFFRYFLILSVIALFSVGVFVRAEEGETDSAASKAAAKVVAKFIGSLFAGAAASCLTEAAFECKSQWKSASGAINCAKEFLAKNKGRCAIGA